jgi:hypothetical protein
MTDLPLPPTGTALATGPSNAGKTRLTARALDAWVAEYGADGVVVLDFAPELERDGTLLGGRLTQFTDVPAEAWRGVLEAHAPRAGGETNAEALSLAAANARRARRIVSAAPASPRVVFVNDATIPFQADGPDGFDPGVLTGYCDRADAAVCNAFESDELGVDDPVSRNERAALEALRAWADRVVEL